MVLVTSKRFHVAFVARFSANSLTWKSIYAMAYVHDVGDRTGFACVICSRLLASFFFQSFF